MSQDCEVEIVGAGSYGLAAAARLRAADSKIDVRLSKMSGDLSFASALPELGTDGVDRASDALRELLLRQAA